MLYHFPAGHIHADPIVASVPTGHAAEQINAPAAENNPLGHGSQTPFLLYEPALHGDEHTPRDPRVVDEPALKFFKIPPAVQVGGGVLENTVFVVDVHVAVTNCVPVGSLHVVHVPGDPVDVEEPALNPLKNLPVVQLGGVENTVFDASVHVAVTYCVPVG